MVAESSALDVVGSITSRPGLRIVDWNQGRRPQGTPGNEIATTFSHVLAHEGDDDPSAVRFVHARMEPNSAPRLVHSHPGWTATIVLSGSIDIEDVTFTEGQMVVVAPDVAYGPLRPGPEGATFVEIFANAAATGLRWDEGDPRVEEYRAKGWIPPR